MTEVLWQFPDGQSSCASRTSIRRLTTMRSGVDGDHKRGPEIPASLIFRTPGVCQP